MHEALDPSRGPDRKEAFNVGLELAPDDPDLIAGKPFRSLNAWPNLPNFRKTQLVYFDASAALGARLHRAFADDLGVSPGFFADKFDRPMATLRLLRYPAPSTVEDDGSAPARIRTTATSRCWRPTTWAGSRFAPATAHGSRRRSLPTPSSSTSAIA